MSKTPAVLFPFDVDNTLLDHYVLIDDKLHILSAVKKIWGERVTAVFPKQGHYAFDPKNSVRQSARGR